MPLTVSASGITFNDLTTLATGRISAVNIAPSSIGTLQLSANAVTTDKIAPGAVVTVDLADSAVTPVKLAQPLTLATAQNATGTSIDFTGIPSWVNRITVIFNGVASSGTSQYLVRLGTASGIATTGYASWWGYMLNAAAVATTAAIDGLGIWNGASVDIKVGHMFLTRVSGNTWVSSHSGGFTNGTGNFIILGGGNATLPGTLDRIRLTTVNGTDTFRLGSINIMYEG